MLTFLRWVEGDRAAHLEPITESWGGDSGPSRWLKQSRCTGERFVHVREVLVLSAPRPFKAQVGCMRTPSSAWVNNERHFYMPTSTFSPIVDWDFRLDEQNVPTIVMVMCVRWKSINAFR